MSSPRDKGKQKAEEVSVQPVEATITEEERKKRSFERSLAGPSVGKAGLIRDQTGESCCASTRLTLYRGQQDHR